MITGIISYQYRKNWHWPKLKLNSNLDLNVKKKNNEVLKNRIKQYFIIPGSGILFKNTTIEREVKMAEWEDGSPHN